MLTPSIIPKLEAESGPETLPPFISILLAVTLKPARVPANAASRIFTNDYHAVEVPDSPGKITVETTFVEPGLML